MRWMFCAALVCSFVIAGAAQSDHTTLQQPARKEPPAGTLRSVKITGNTLYTGADIIKYSGLKPGQRVTGSILEQARKRLQESELFSDVADEYKYSAGNPPEYDVTFQVQEIDQLFPMRFERLGADPQAISSYLREHVDLYSDRIPGTEGVLQRYTAAVQDFVSKTNPNMKVRAAISNDDPQQLTVLFTPNAPAPTISQVFVSGNQAIDTGTILRAVNQVAIGAPLSDTRLKMILDGAIKPLYAAKGYAAVSFPKVETEPAKTNLGVIVKVEIKDGPQYKFGVIRFHGSGLDEDEIRSNITFKPGQVFNGEQVDNFRLNMVHRLRRKGLLDASIVAEAQPDDSKRVVSISYNVNPGAVYNFQTLDIQGLDITAQPAIEKLWGEKPGHAFNPDYPDFFLKRVQQEGIFDNLADTHSDYTADASTHNVTVHLYFKGGKSKAQSEKEKKEREGTSDGTWNPLPPE